MPQQAAQPFEIPTRLPLITELQNRAASTSFDAKLVNCFVERDHIKGEYWIQKRMGLAVKSSYTCSGAGQGLYYSSIAQVLVGINGGNVSEYAGSTISLGSTSIGDTCKFEEVINATVSTYIVFGDGFSAYYIPYGTTNTPTKITDPNFPTIFCKGWAFVDGTLYVMTPSGQIFGSKNLNDPSAWDLANVIVAQAYPDKAICLTKQLSYVVALKQWSMQLFYDAGNAVGSPLAIVPGGIYEWGCISADSVSDIDDLLFWASYNKDIAAQIIMMKNLQIKIVSTPAVDKLLSNLTPSGLIRSLTFKLMGHRFYILTLPTNNITLVYDIDEEFWYLWTDSNGNYWPISAASVDALGNHVMQDSAISVSAAHLYTLNDASVQANDYGNLIPVDIYTPNYDGGIDRRKMLEIMRFNADQTKGSTLYVRHSEDDYKSWSNFRKVDLGVKRPFLDKCGTFRRRAYHFRHLANTPFRIKSVDLQMALGAL